MENEGKRLSDVVRYFKSWIPWSSQLRNLWMPSNSWTVCYDCDFHFGFFSPRHHCPFCGRIFCARCSTNLVHPEISSHEINNHKGNEEHIRVCNFCFEQCNEDGKKVIEVHDEVPGLSHDISPSMSERNLFYLDSISNRGNTVGCSLRSSGQYQGVSIHSSYNTSSPSTHVKPRKQEPSRQTKTTGSISHRGKSPPDKFRYDKHRRKDDDSDACLSQPASKVQYYHKTSRYYGLDDFYGTDEVHSPEQSIDANLFTSTITGGSEFNESMNDTENVTKEESDNVYVFNANSPTYNKDGNFSEIVDFENNEMLWLPPPPANVGNDEFVSFDEDDGEASAGDFAYVASSKSIGSGEYHIQQQSMFATKDVVIGHFRSLVCQLLQVEDLPMGDEYNKESWLEIITSLSWEVASLLKPDTSLGGGMDPGGYAKIKCLPCGNRSYSSVVKGVVCRKNLAHRRMKSRIEKPRILLLGGALEYQNAPNHLSSFDTLLHQETDHLKMAVDKIEACSPNILLVEKSVSRFAQDHLLAKGISLVLNVKRCLLERISRCTGSSIIPCIDQLLSQNLGTCELFHIEKFCEELSSSGHNQKSLMKNLMFFEGCPKPLGCTVLLMGAHKEELKKVKQIVQYGIFAAYHLALETSFLADEGASLPELPFKTGVAAAFPERPFAFGSTTMSGSSMSFTSNTIERGNEFISSGPSSLSCNVGTEKKFQHISCEGHDSPSTGNSFCSISSSIDFKGSAEKDFNDRNSAQTLTSHCFSSPHLFAESDYCYPSSDNYLHHTVSTGNFKKTFGQINNHGNENDINFSTTCTKPSYVADGRSCKVISQVGKKTIGDLFGPYFGSLLEDIAYLQEQESYVKEDSPPSDHQSILVSLSTRCVWKETVCERGHLFRMKYYGCSDKPLGRFLLDHLFDQYYQCHSCEMPSEAHVHCYTHRQGSLTISVRKIEEVLAGAEDGKIWMWHSCLRCPLEDGNPPRNLRVIMSDAAWGLSFGKFLELSFSNHAAATRVASCGHSLHRDCLRFYGFGQMVACFRYASVQSHSVCLPPRQLQFSTKIQDWIQEEVNEVTDKAEMLFTGVLNAISQLSEEELKSRSVRKNTVLSELRYYMVTLERMLHEEKVEFEECLYNVLKNERKEGNLFIDVLEINKLRRRLFFHSYLWDQRLLYASRLHMNLQDVIDSEEKSVEFSSSESPRPNSSDSLPLKIRNNEHSTVGAGRVDQVVEFSSMQRPHSCLETESHENYKCRYGTFSSPGHQFDQSSAVVHRSLSDGQISLKADLPETLDAKWAGEKVDTFVVPEKLENNTKIDNDQCLIVSHMTEGNCTDKDIGRWSEMPFLAIYQSFFMKVVHNSSFLSSVLHYDPVYVPRFWELDYDHGGPHMFPLGKDDIDILIYDDEPSSIISYALVSSEYEKKLAIERIRLEETGQSTSLSLEELGVIQHSTSSEELSLETLQSVKTFDDTRLSMPKSKKSIELNQNVLAKSENIKVSFTYEDRLGKVVYGVTCYCAVHFDVLRQLCCPSELDYVRSLSRCKKWGAQGGKSNVFFAKTLDDRFIIKQVTKTELVSFLDFGAKYFQYVCEAISSRNPTCLAKVVGIYQIMIHHVKSGRESKIDVLVMENLLYGRKIMSLYDLKGSSRSRYNADSSGNNKVLLDQNLIEAMPTSPIFVGNKAKQLLERAIWNDTSFLASVDVMDYSLLVGVDVQTHQLVLGIIDFMRQYTWDKHLETWVKSSGFLGGSKNSLPTVVSPQQYRKRFRKAMTAYFLMLPEQCSSTTIIPTRSQSDFGGEVTQQFSPG